MTDAYQRANPRRRSKQGRSARMLKRLKLAKAKTDVIQGSHKGFRKSKYTAIFVAPCLGKLTGFIVMENLLGHASAVVKFEETSNLEFPVRNKKTDFPATTIQGGETVRVYITPVENEATVDRISVGMFFKEIKE